MAKLSTDELLDAFKELTLLELSEFVKKFEETFEVTAAAPVAIAGPAAAAAGAPAEAAEEQADDHVGVLERELDVHALEVLEGGGAGLVRLGDGGQRHPHHPAESLSAAQLHRCGVLGADPPLSAPSDQALLRALRRQSRRG